MATSRTGRRDFLRAAAGIAGAPWIATGWGFGGEGAPPSERIRIAHIGAGGRGMSLLEQSLGTGDVEVIGVCDVDRQRLEGAVKRAGGKAEGNIDYRAHLDRREVDAVVIASPDHWHALMTIDAAAAGKDIYVEKPLCTFPAEGRAMVAAARKHGRIVQVGINHRSEGDIREIAEIVRSAQSIHPADRAGYIQSWSKTMGLPSSYSRGIYSNLGRSGGVNTYTARDLSKKPYQPTYR